MSIAADMTGDAIDAALARRRLRTLILFLLLGAGVVIVSGLSIGTGALALAPSRVVAVLRAVLTGTVPDDMARDALVVVGIRLPRTLLGVLVGASLAVSGALMQGLFRNPLADPGLAGVSSGAALFAAGMIVLGERLVALTGPLPFITLPMAAFGGALLTTFTLYRIATRAGRTSVATLLLAGVALGALAGALTGVLTFLSDDRQLRDLTFWSLGSLGGATWAKTATVAPAILPVLVAVPFLARGLNALALGEAEAFHLGIAVERVKQVAIFLVAVAVGASVAVSGIIGFVGIVVPHLLRLAIGPDHRVLLPASALLGGILLVLSDMLARTLVQPAELPIGIVTAAIGAPFFLWLLLTGRRSLAL